MNILGKGLRGAFTASCILLISSHALAGEAESRKECESMAELSKHTFQVEKSEWVAASRMPAGPGGKMIVYHGLSDQAMWTGALTRWCEKLTPRDNYGPQSWARLFLVPGMTHCGGGQSTDQFDMLTAIQQWVEKGKAPDRVIASGKAFPGKTRPLCPYPKVARFDGGDPDSKESFACR